MLLTQGTILFQYITKAEDIEPPFKVYNYFWEYLPTKQTGKHLVGCLNDNDFCRLIGAWNKADPERWKYTACDAKG